MANGDELNQMSDREPSNPLRTNSDTNIVMIILMMKITTAEDLIGIEWIWNGLEKTGIEMLYFFFNTGQSPGFRGFSCTGNGIETAVQ